jgi:radical SAM protein with 4Fe4S-binding SPASM domain
VAYPSTIMLELTNHCNLACTTCAREYAFGKEMDKGMINKDMARKVIDEAWPYLDSIGLTGMGETFLYKEIEEIADYIKSKNRGIILSVSTNAQLPDFIGKVSKLVNKVDTIQVSVDGLDDIYESIRKNAVFKQLDNHLKQLVELCKDSDTDLMLNMVVTKENYQHMPLLVDYAHTHRIRYVDFTLFNLAAATGIDQSYYHFYKSPEFLKAVSQLEDTATACKDVNVNSKNLRTGNEFQQCPFPWTHFYICWNGYSVPCCAKPFPKEMNFGNVFENGLLKTLNHESYRQFRALWYSNKAPGFCEKCHFIDI